MPPARTLVFAFMILSFRLDLRSTGPRRLDVGRGPSGCRAGRPSRPATANITVGPPDPPRRRIFSWQGKLDPGYADAETRSTMAVPVGERYRPGQSQLPATAATGPRPLGETLMTPDSPPDTESLPLSRADRVDRAC